MSKKYCIFLTVLFCGFITLFMAANAIAPDRKFSQVENRYLQQMPTLKGSDFALDGKLFTGKFMADFETYVTDQFVARDLWTSFKARSEVAVGKQENNGVYLGGQETLIPHFKRPDPERVVNNMSYVNKLVDNVDIPVTFALIPGKVSVWADRLPDHAPNASEADIIAQAKDAVTAQWADLDGAMRDHASEDIYYRLDHHWTSLGAYYGYAALMDALGMEAVPLSGYEKQTLSTDFNGTTYSSSGVHWFPPDVIDIYVPDEDITVTSWFGPEPAEGKLYDRAKLAEKDQYSMFMGGNQSLAVVKGSNTTGPKLLIVRDSYTDSLVPFLTAHFSEVHLFDPRYNKTPLTNYISENDIDQAVVMYSVANFTADSNLFVLSQ